MDIADSTKYDFSETHQWEKYQINRPQVIQPTRAVQELSQ